MRIRMLDKKDIETLKELIKPLATKKDLVRERDFLAKMMKNSFDVTPTREEMNEGFRTINTKLDSKVEGLNGRVKTLEDALAIE